MTMPSRRPLFPYAAILSVLITLVAIQQVQSAKAENLMENARAATVQITAIASPPDFKKPWQTSDTEQSAGSGAIIDGHRILTNAHVVANAVSIEVKRNGQADKYVAEIEYINHACDLAILMVEEPDFFTGVDPLSLGDLPEIQTEVQAYGFPVGGESVSITTGVISRIELSMYAHSYREILSAQIDAAINPGNSGGPVLADGKLVGIAMQTMAEGENVGYMIPSPVVRHFLQDVEDGSVDGIPYIGGEFQALESEALRSSLGLAKGESGMLTLRVNHKSACWGVLEQGDVILAVEGFEVANDGTINSTYDIPLDFEYLAHKRQVGESLELTILRDGQRQTKSITLNNTNLLVPPPTHQAKARYRIFGGLVFQPINFDYLLALEAQEAEFSSYLYWMSLEDNLATAERQELVALASVLPHKVNRGYQEWANDVVVTVQGIDVQNMAHFNQLLDEAEGRWLEITLHDHTVVVLDLEEARGANEEILEKFNIAKDRWGDSKPPTS